MGSLEDWQAGGVGGAGRVREIAISTGHWCSLGGFGGWGGQCCLCQGLRKWGGGGGLAGSKGVGEIMRGSLIPPSPPCLISPSLP